MPPNGRPQALILHPVSSTIHKEASEPPNKEFKVNSWYEEFGIGNIFKDCINLQDNFGRDTVN